MTPERAAELVARWVRLYTRSLPPSIAQRRIDEIRADLHDHVEHERARRTDERRIALSVLSRMLRGLAADISWRGTRIARPTTQAEAKMSNVTRRPGVRIAVATASILLVPLVAMQLTDEVDWGVADFVFAAAFLGGAGFLLHRLTARKPGTVVSAGAAIAVAVAAIVLGEADDAPGLVLFGCLLILGTVALGIRTVQRSG